MFRPLTTMGLLDKIGGPMSGLSTETRKLTPAELAAGRITSFAGAGNLRAAREVQDRTHWGDLFMNAGNHFASWEGVLFWGLGGAVGGGNVLTGIVVAGMGWVVGMSCKEVAGLFYDSALSSNIS
jgi:hypothetical protein